ncbi:hypothetical protein ACGFK1_09630 [Mycobacterium sp. NPDC048908]|uniref:hypothetical protein n=1 Tax=Mycobacterium sp. NPDC048908 TaxID=3364292 RepID=UPI003710B1DA
MFANAGGECESILQRLDLAEDVYFDEVSQIVMPRWFRGRIATIGDAAAAAFAPTTAPGLWVRNHATKLLAIPYIGERILSRQLSDGFTLPTYGI